MLDLIVQRAVKVVYQPIVQLDSNTVIGYEALARGPKKERPQDMFPEAKALELLREFELQCMQKALLYAPAGDLFINVRPITLLYLTKKIMPLPKAEHIVFEIVEAEEIPPAYKADFVACIKTLRNEGYKIAIDDISSGYNRLELISLLKPNYIKLDAPLIQGGLYSNVILQQVVDMAKSLNIKTIAECIETEQQLDLIRDIGVDYGQGFLLGMYRSSDSLAAIGVL